MYLHNLVVVEAAEKLPVYHACILKSQELLSCTIFNTLV